MQLCLLSTTSSYAPPTGQEKLRQERLERERKEKQREGMLFIKQAEAVKGHSAVPDGGYSSMFNPQLMQQKEERKQLFQQRRQQQQQHQQQQHHAGRRW